MVEQTNKPSHQDSQEIQPTQEQLQEGLNQLHQLQNEHGVLKEEHGVLKEEYTIIRKRVDQLEYEIQAKRSTHNLEDSFLRGYEEYHHNGRGFPMFPDRG